MPDVTKNFNLIMRGNMWHYRRRVPTELLAAFNGKAVLKYSLKTNDIHEARKRRDVEQVKWNQKFAELQSGSPSEPKGKTHLLSDDEVRGLIRDYVSRRTNAFTQSIESSPPDDSEQRAEMLEEQDWVLSNLQAHNHHAEEWMQAAWAKLENDAKERNAQISETEPLLTFLLRGLMEVARRKTNILNHDYSHSHIDLGFAPTNKSTTKFGVLAKAYVERYKEFAKLNGRTPKAVDKVAQSAAMVVDLVGSNTPVESIDYDFLDKFTLKLARVPANYKKLFKGKSLDEAIELAASNNARVLSPNTQRNYLSAITQILKMAVAKKVIPSMPVVDLKPAVEDKVKAKDKKKGFTIDQLKTFFSGSFYHAVATGDDAVLKKPDFDWRFWLPIVGLYSGMRGNEMSLLLPSDICVTAKGTHYFQVTDEVSDVADSGQSKSVKTETSVRNIPIHNVLIKLGFLDFVARQKAKNGNARLFENLKPDKYDNYFHYAGRRFNEVFLPNEMGSLKRQSFHSFRHTFRNALRQTNASPDTLQALGGWDQEGLTSSNYGELSQPDHQKKFLNAVKFDDLDLTAITVKKLWSKDSK